MFGLVLLVNIWCSPLLPLELRLPVAPALPPFFLGPWGYPFNRSTTLLLNRLPYAALSQATISHLQNHRAVRSAHDHGSRQALCAGRIAIGGLCCRYDFVGFSGPAQDSQSGESSRPIDLPSRLVQEGNELGRLKALYINVEASLGGTLVAVGTISSRHQCTLRRRCWQNTARGAAPSRHRPASCK